jgi:DNA mismatch endonuclease (patch repair protein)
MRGNLSRDTQPEVRLRSLLHRRGYRFTTNTQVQTPKVRVRPDIVFGRKRVAVFVDGCFWHSCKLHRTIPRVNRGYWGPKLRRVTRRDRRVGHALIAEGWLVVRVWEHQPAEQAVKLVETVLRRR